jgi:hypothetical protein
MREWRSTYPVFLFTKATCIQLAIFCVSLGSLSFGFVLSERERIRVSMNVVLFPSVLFFREVVILMRVSWKKGECSSVFRFILHSIGVRTFFSFLVSKWNRIFISSRCGNHGKMFRFSF